MSEQEILKRFEQHVTEELKRIEKSNAEKHSKQNQKVLEKPYTQNAGPNWQLYCDMYAIK